MKDTYELINELITVADVLQMVGEANKLLKKGGK